jgi:hypothetical protein
MQSTLQILCKCFCAPTTSHQRAYSRNLNHGLLNLNCAALITAVTKLGFSMEQLIPLTSKNSPLTNSIC